MNYEPKSDKRSCTPEPISNRARTIAQIYLIAIAIGVFSNLLLMYYFKHSYISLLGSIYHFQML